jgi:hypothetical protein
MVFRSMQEEKETRCMSDIFGDYLELDNEHEYLVICFSPSSLPIHRRWRHNGLSADFLADYCSTFFPSDEQSSPRKQAEIKSLVAYVANELLENSMKFNYGPSQHTISVKLSLLPDECYFYTSNCIDPDAVESFQAYLRKLQAENPGELYLKQLELNAQDEDNSVSRLGFLTMLCDYQARLGWKFTLLQEDPKTILLTTMVRLEI